MTEPTTVTAHRPASLHLGALFTILSALGFASMDAMSKLLVRDYAISQTLWIRYAVFTLFALLIARRSGVRRTFRSRRPWLQAARSLLGLVENGIFVLAFLYLPLADTHAVAATSPLIVVALSTLFLHERPDLRRWLAVAAAFAGVLLIIRPGFQTLSWPLLLPLGGALLWAIYQMLIRVCAGYDRPETTLLWTAWVGFAATSFIGPWQWHTPDATAWALLAGVALLGSLSHYALIKALDYAAAGAIQPYSYFLLVFAALLGVLVFGDIPDAWTITGAAIVVLSGLYTWRRDRIA
ncbi:MAG: DMT family transporter [Acetobacteraceae bacterium]